MKHLQDEIYIAVFGSLLVLAGCQDVTTSPTGPDAQVEEPNGRVKNYVLMSEPPTELLNRMRILYRPNDPEWAKVLNEFVESRHPIVAYVVGELKGNQKIEESVAKDIQERIVIGAEQQLSAQETIELLELACYADVMCHSIEYPLRVATFQHIQYHKDEDEVVEALQWIKSSYQCRVRTDSFRDTPDFVKDSLPQSMKVRLTEYADALSQATDEIFEGQTARRFVKPVISKEVRLK